MAPIKNSLSDKTLINIKQGGIPVIIFGAGIVGEVLFRACREAGIKVECFCDNNINKKSPVYDLEVVHASRIVDKYKDAIFLISAAEISDVVDQLLSIGYSKWYSSASFLRDFDIFQHQFSAPADFVEFAVSTCLLCHDRYLNPGKLFLRSIDIILTERCSLRCRDCSNLMQYYNKPKDVDIKELSRAIDAFCAIVDEVNEFRVIGGEPFMHRQFHLIVQRLIDEPKIRKVVIYTNGTIIPGEDQIQYMKNGKVLILITDYGAISRKTDALIEVLQHKRIAFYRLRIRGWTDCAKIEKHGRGMEEQREVFRSCCARNLATLSDGKLYRCPFSANASRLHAVPECRTDYIDILERPEGTVDAGKAKDRVRDFLLGKDFLGACDYCNGRPFDAPEIPPAVQINRPLDYERF